LYAPKSWSSNLSSGIAGAYASLEKKVLVTASTIEAENYTLEEFAAKAKKSYAKMDGYESVIEPTTATVDNHEAYYLVFDGKVKESKEKTVVYRFKIYLIKKDANLVTITYAAPKEYYKDYTSDLDLIIGEFKFRDDVDIKKDTFMDTKKDAPEGYQIASNDKYEFRFYVPDTWTVNRRSYNPKAYYSDTDMSNVTITTKVMDETVNDGKSYWESFKAESPENYKVLDEKIDENAKMGKYDAFSVEYTYEVVGVSYMVKQVFLPFEGNGNIYIFTYTSRPRTYEKHLDDVNKMIEMFEFK
ncbi:MAG: hypothetical protein IJW79_03615, partial [Clostridia bacterium]|nr:hypothetical protein [Clostridia bacterium]